MKTFWRILEVLALLEEGAEIDRQVLSKRWGVSLKTVMRTVQNAEMVRGKLRKLNISISFGS